MKVLWITNIMLPGATTLMNKQKDLKGSGGWILGLAEALLYNADISLSIVSISPVVKKIKKIQEKRITYYIIPSSGRKDIYNSKYEREFRDLYLKVRPDIVHIHGTEYPHSLAALRACGADHTVVSMQGLVSTIAPLFLGGIDRGTILRNITFHDIIRDSLFQQQHKMARCGCYEKQLLRESKYVMGRTSWDKAHLWAINPKAFYFHCDEILRQEFYDDGEWSYSTCKQHSIFVSQGYYPLKGLHFLIKALVIVRQYYPDVVLRIAGSDFTFSEGGLSKALRLTSYGKMIRRIIRRNNLEDCVCFTGLLSAEYMRREYLGCNVFVCPSIIENSPNSLCEAQMLGTPILASYVGGVPDLMKGEEFFLYRAEDIDVLASKICWIFEQRDNLNNNRARRMALDRHNRIKNAYSVVEVYDNICKHK